MITQRARALTKDYNNLSNTDISKFTFTDCHFGECNLSMVRSAQTRMSNIQFSGCKIVGFHFDHCNQFGLSVAFKDCILNLSSFFNMKLEETGFINSALIETDFTACDLTAALFDNCDLNKAVFDGSVLEKADFRSSYNYSIDPQLNKIRKAKFSMNAVVGLLNAYDIVIEP